MLSQQYHRLVSAFIMSVLMVFIMTAIITAVNTGIEGNFLHRWWEAMVVAWPIAFIIILLISKHVQKTAAKICCK